MPSAFIRPRYGTAVQVFRRAADRGELRDDLDLDLVWDLVPGLLLYSTCARAGPY